jgi:hypothetical protein
MISRTKPWPTATCPWQPDGHYAVSNDRAALQITHLTVRISGRPVGSNRWGLWSWLWVAISVPLLIGSIYHLEKAYVVSRATDASAETKQRAFAATLTAAVFGALDTRGLRLGPGLLRGEHLETPGGKVLSALMVELLGKSFASGTVSLEELRANIAANLRRDVAGVPVDATYSHLFLPLYGCILGAFNHAELTALRTRLQARSPLNGWVGARLEGMQRKIFRDCRARGVSVTAFFAARPSMDTEQARACARGTASGGFDRSAQVDIAFVQCLRAAIRDEIARASSGLGDKMIAAQREQILDRPDTLAPKAIAALRAGLNRALAQHHLLRQLEIADEVHFAEDEPVPPADEIGAVIEEKVRAAARARYIWLYRYRSAAIAEDYRRHAQMRARVGGGDFEALWRSAVVRGLRKRLESPSAAQRQQASAQIARELNKSLPGTLGAKYSQEWVAKHFTSLSALEAALRVSLFEDVDTHVRRAMEAAFRRPLSDSQLDALLTIDDAGELFEHPVLAPLTGEVLQSMLRPLMPACLGHGRESMPMSSLGRDAHPFFDFWDEKIHQPMVSDAIQGIPGHLLGRDYDFRDGGACEAAGRQAVIRYNTPGFALLISSLGLLFHMAKLILYSLRLVGMPSCLRGGLLALACLALLSLPMLQPAPILTHPSFGFLVDSGAGADKVEEGSGLVSPALLIEWTVRAQEMLYPWSDAARSYLHHATGLDFTLPAGGADGALSAIITRLRQGEPEAIDALICGPTICRIGAGGDG